MRAPAPPPVPRRSRGGATPALAAVCAVLAAGLAVGGLFGPLYSFDHSRGELRTAHELTWWGVRDDGSTSGTLSGPSSLIGLTLVTAAVVLVLGAVFAFLSGRSLRPGVRTAGRSLISGGLGVLAGVTALQLLDGLGEAGWWNEIALDPGDSVSFMVGLGLWLPLGAVVLAAVAVVLAHRGPRVPRREPATPPMGFPRPRQYGPGPMTGPQPAVQAGQSSGRFAPVPPPAAPPRGHQPAPAETGPSPASRSDESTSEHDPDSDITQRTTVPTEPSPASDDTWNAAAADPAAGTSTPESPAEQVPADRKAAEPARLDLPPAPPAPELSGDPDGKKSD